jgi:hypothetical protein
MSSASSSTPRRGGAGAVPGVNRSIAKAMKEMQETKAAGGDMGRFRLSRLPLNTIKLMEVLPVFDHIPSDRPEVYAVNEAMLFGQRDWIGSEFKTCVLAGQYKEAADLLLAEVPQPAYEGPERCTISNTSILDYASRRALPKEEALQLVKRHAFERFKMKNVQFKNGHIETLDVNQ